MDDKKSPNKIKIETEIYYHQKNSQLKWGDIKHLQLEDDDLIYSNWEDDENGGCWNGVILRMVEETDEEFQKRLEDIALDAKWAKERRYESYLRLKKEFENGEQ
jgi:hypothetical protein